MTTFQRGAELDIPGLGFVGSARSDQQKKRPEQPKSGFFETLEAAFRNEVTGLTYDFVVGPGSEYDPSFVLTRDMMQRATDGVAQEYWSDFANANSEEDLKNIREYALERTRRMGVIANAGTTSRVAASIIAGVFDPISLTAGAVTGGAGMGVGLTKAARITRAASAGFLTNAAIESYRATLDPTVRGSDIAMSALSGAGMGVGIGSTISRSIGTRALATGLGAAAPVVPFQSDNDALESGIAIGTAFLAGGIAGSLTPRVREELAPIIKKQVKAMAHEEMVRTGELTPEGQAYFADAADPKVAQARQAAAAESVSFGLERDATLFNEEMSRQYAGSPKPPVETAVGAATQSDTVRTAASPFGDTYDQTIPLPKNGFFTPQQATDSYSTGLHLFTAEAMVGRSPVSSIRRIGNMVFDDFVPKSDGNMYEAAPNWIRSRVGEFANPFTRVAEKSFADASSALSMTDDQISRAWYKAVVTGAKDAPEEIRAMVDATAPLMKQLLDFEKSHQVPGAADVPANEFYLPRKGRRDLIDSLVLKYGEEAVADVVAQAFKARRPLASDDLAQAIGKAWIRRIGVPSKAEFIRPDAFDTVINLLEEANVKRDLIDEARIVLEDHVANATDRGLIAQLRQTADPVARAEIKAQILGKADAGNPSNFKFRLDLDELVETTMPDGTRLSLLDMIETDPRVLIPHRIRRGAGNAAFAQILKWAQNPVAPARPLTSLAELLDSLRQDAKAAGLAENAEEGNIRRIEFGLKHAIGMPIDDMGNPSTQRAARVAKITNELVGAKFLSGTMTGLANLTETLGAMADTQIRVTFQLFPALFELRKAALDGKLTNNDIALAEAFTGGGFERLSNHAPHRPMGPATNRVDRALTWLEPKSRRVTDTLMRVSLMEAGNDLSQKLIGAKIVRMWTNWIKSEKKPADWQIKGTNLEGRPWMVERIMAQGKKYGIKNGKDFDLNWHDWDDVEAAAALRAAVSLEYNRAFFQPNNTNSYKWAATWWGKLFIQLKRWPVGAFRSKLVYGFATGDIRHWSALTTATVAGSMVYIIRTYAESLGQDDPEKFREERLSMGAIARATVGRAGWASLLPNAIDGAAAIGGFEPPFAISSTTGRKADLFNPANIPALGAVNDLARAGQSVVQPAVSDEYSFSMEDIRRIEKAIMPNAIKQLHIIDAVGRMLGLPEKSKE